MNAHEDRHLSPVRSYQNPFFRLHAFAPGPLLRGIAAGYTVLVARKPEADTLPWHIMPDGAPHLIFHAYSPDRDHVPPSRLAIVGPRTVYKDIDRRHRQVSVMVRLRPGRLAGALPFAPAALADRSVPAAMVWGEVADVLEEKLLGCWGRQDVGGCVATMESALAELLPPADHGRPAVAGAVRFVEASHGTRRVADAARHVDLSTRRLRELFARYLGLSPKRFARITRVTRAVRLGERRARPPWAQLAVEAGFFDQSHMIDEFQALLGQSPEPFLKRINRE